MQLIEVGSVEQDWKSADEAEVGRDDDETRRGLKAAVVRRRKFHLELGAVARFADKVVGNLLLHSRIGDHDVMPWLRVRAGGTVTRGLQDHFHVLARDVDVGSKGAAGEPIADHVHHRLIARNIWRKPRQRLVHYLLPRLVC